MAGVLLLLLSVEVGRADAGYQAPLVTINEFVASNRTCLTDGEGNTPDWIELYNGGAAPVSLAGWSLTDSRRDLQKWTFPPGAVLSAGGYLVVCASGQPTDGYVDKKGYYHTTFALDKDGEYLALVDPDGAVVHEYSPSFPSQQTDVSYGLYNGEFRYFSPPTPGKANGQGFLGLVGETWHSDERGFYDDAFDLWISCDVPDAVIRYTLDGSEPTELHGLVLVPGSSIPILTTTCVRSVAFKTGWVPAEVATHTYIFVDDVARQPASVPGWPTDWGYSSDAGGIVPADYEMDPRVVDNTLPGYSIRDALLDIPTVSISMLREDFISHARGIYANPQSRWERKCAIEYILPDGMEGFQYDCKIEVHGNASRRPYRMQKHSLRLTFTSEYGPAKLEYPLFPDSPVQQFNQLVLRACFTDSWALVSWARDRYRPNDSQYIRDFWMKESLHEMGQPSSGGSFVHLYVNGLYFGLHNLSERIREEFFADHLGGRPEDWEINKDLSAPRSRWNAMMAVDPSTFAGYMQMQEYLDVENFADYMLLHFYADAEDWPHHNGYAAANATSGDGRFRFFVWDQEIVLDYHGRGASRIDATGGAGSLFQKMRTSEEFRLLFADRFYKHCFNDGALALTTSQDRYRRLAGWIDKAIVAESARWGDVQMSTPYGNVIEQPNPLTNINHDNYPPAPHGPDYYFTREDSWVVERDNVINNYIPAIHDVDNSYALIRVLRTKNLYPDIDPPRLRIDGVPQHGGSVSPGSALTMMNPNPGGAIYFTLDGADPRVPGAGALQDDPGVLVSEQAAKRVLIPTSDIGQGWKDPSYDDSFWLGGTGGVGYERATGFEPYFGIDVNSRMYNVNTTCYVRIPFNLDPSLVSRPSSLASDERPATSDATLTLGPWEKFQEGLLFRQIRPFGFGRNSAGLPWSWDAAGRREGEEMKFVFLLLLSRPSWNFSQGPATLRATSDASFTRLTLQVRYDDGFIAYLNGAEVARANFAGTPQWNSIANASHADAEAVSFVDFDLTAHAVQTQDFASLLTPGENLLAIHALNASPMSSDFLISVRLLADTTQPQPNADPRISPSAVPYAGPIPILTTTHVKARILDRDQWSALAETTFVSE